LYIQLNGTKLQYLDWGGQGQPLALFAGLGFTGSIFSGLAPRLTRHFHVVALTRRGHGRSDKPEADYDLEVFVEDIRQFLDELEIEKAVLGGHSFGGIEILHFARRYPHRVKAILYLDALFPKLDPEPDLSGDPVYAALPGAPTMDDLASLEAFTAYYKRVRPDLAWVWSPPVEADLMEKITLQEDGRVIFHHDDALMNRIYANTFISGFPDYRGIEVPTLAIVPSGDSYPGVPLDASEELRKAADTYWREKLHPWIRKRTETFRQAAPSAKIVELDSPSHHIFIAREDETVEAIEVFLVLNIDT
jgi:pimeloyl-ACP methyl ester carboxylesterase